MKKMKKILALLLASVMVMSLAACGGSSSTESTTAAPATEAAAEDEAEAPEAEAAASDTEKAPEDYTGTLVVYSPHDEDPLNAGIAAFEAKYPNVTVELVADGTGNLLARIAAESAAPMADVLWGGGADSLAAYKDYFQAYCPTCIDVLTDGLYDDEYYWIGESPLPMVFLVNTDMVDEDDIPYTWADLADPKWEGKIAIADPTSSGSAFTQLCTMLMLYGDEADDYQAGWDFVSSLMDNLVIQSGSSAAHKNVDAGEYPVGITLEKAAVQYDTSPETGHLIMIYPEDGTSAVPDGVAIVKDCPNQELAELFEEFVLSEECQVDQNANYGRRPIRTDIELVGLDPIDTIPMMDYNFEYAAVNADDIKDTWKDVQVQ